MNTDIPSNILKLYEIWSNDYKKYDQLMWVNMLTILASSALTGQHNTSTILSFSFNLFLLFILIKHKQNQDKILDRLITIENEYIKIEKVEKTNIQKIPITECFFGIGLTYQILHFILKIFF